VWFLNKRYLNYGLHIYHYYSGRRTKKLNRSFMFNTNPPPSNYIPLKLFPRNAVRCLRVRQNEHHSPTSYMGRGAGGGEASRRDISPEITYRRNSVTSQDTAHAKIEHDWIESLNFGKKCDFSNKSRDIPCSLTFRIDYFFAKIHI
jgi:hypothetical protein